MIYVSVVFLVFPKVNKKTADPHTYIHITNRTDSLNYTNMCFCWCL